MPGPAPQPNYLKIIRGNRGRRPLPKNEPKPPGKIPTPPPFLGKIGRNEWRRITPKLAALGLIDLLDRNTLGAYCNAYENLTECRVHLLVWNSQNPDQFNQVATATGGRKTHPLVAQMIAHEKNMIMFGREFGLSPSSRGRLDIVPTDPKARNKFAQAANPDY